RTGLLGASLLGACRILEVGSGAVFSLGELLPAGVRFSAEGFPRRRRTLIAELLHAGAITVRHRNTGSGRARPGGGGDVRAGGVVVPERVDRHAVLEPIDSSPDCGAGDESGAEAVRGADGIARWVPIEWRVIGIWPGAIHNARVIDRDVILVGVCRLDGVDG